MAPPSAPKSAAAAGLSLDALLAQHAKTLKPGETITLNLVKGPTTSTVDPLLARAASAKSTAPPDYHSFPRLAKFIETVERPNFAPGGAFRGGRLYEEDVPKVKDESDEEEEPEPGRPKKKRWRRNEPPRRHWILQEKSEFVEKMSAKRRRKGAAAAPTNNEGEEKLSTRYEGLHEQNPSHYVLLTIAPPPDENNGVKSEGDGTSASIPPPPKPATGTVRPDHAVCVLPVQGFHAFAQPEKFSTLSMHEAERAITDQRNNMSRYMMHGKMSEKGDAQAELMAEKRGAAAGGGKKGGGLSKARLLGRLSSKGAGDDDDDIMGDLAYRERKGGSAKARKELLTNLGEGATVDEDGVLGGANDTEFGGRRRFGKLAMPGKKKDDDDKKQDGDATKSGKGGGASGGAGNDGQAMDDDFYQRDVAAEYDEMDYDANEQFDDDDVDVGETNVEVDGEGGFAAEHDDDDDDYDDDEYDEDELANAMASGLASAAGTKLLNAKARGETVEEVAPADGKTGGADGKGGETKEGEKAGGEEKNDPLAKVIAGAAEAKQKAEEKKKAKAEAEKAKVKAIDAEKAVEFDQNGQRFITLDAVRREIWLHHGAITTKRLMKIFDIKKKASAVRQNKFREVVKELCTMKMDNVDGNMLVLKQHYSKME